MLLPMSPLECSDVKKNRKATGDQVVQYATPKISREINLEKLQLSLEREKLN